MNESASDRERVLSYTNLTEPVLSTPLMRSGPYLVTAFRATLPPICPICGNPGNDKPEQLRVSVAESFAFTIRPRLPYVFLNVNFCERHYQIRRHALNIMIVLATIAI